MEEILPIKESKFEWDSEDRPNKATCEIKIGRLTEKVTFKRCGDSDVEVIKPDTVKAFEAGYGKLDWQPLIHSFNESIKTVKEDAVNSRIEKELKRWKEVIEWWKSKEKDPDVDLEFTNKEAVIESAKRGGMTVFSVFMVYKNVKCRIEWKNVSRNWFDEKMKFSFSGDITDYKTRNYTSLKSATRKFKELVENQIKEEARQKRINENKLASEEEFIAEINGFLPDVHVEKKVNHRRHHPRGKAYRIATFFVEFGSQHVQISRGTEEGTYNFGEFKSLTRGQINKIINILI